MKKHVNTNVNNDELCLHIENGENCSDQFNCCDCGTRDENYGCGCRGCFSCNACKECLEE